ncbi:MAG TPA: NADH:ubiquinone oxidoreductase [Bacteroidales bacterium]|nr:NADH:ubiquinone oxidoreductase [Bacteroidales bacterium]HPT04512.1 NADH:ubiquinone oxidoreductase [Bacteroidales bacterium]
MPVKEFTIFRRHRYQAIPDLRLVTLPSTFRGRPVISSEITETETAQVATLCPVGAIQVSPCRIDLGRCVYCNECHFALPEKITFTNDYRLATNVRESLIVEAGMDIPVKPDPDKIRKKIRSIFRHALKLRQVSAGGDNSAEMELNAAGNVNFDMGRYGIEFVASPRHADGIVITGPITSNMAEALQICYDAVPEPKLIILAGTDAISGGIFAGSPELNREFIAKHPADLFVPGNPPHPLTFIHGVMEMIGRKF